jgi:hypothetical protein
MTVAHTSEVRADSTSSPTSKSEQILGRSRLPGLNLPPGPSTMTWTHLRIGWPKPTATLMRHRARN